ncbi:MAG: chromosome segregation protein SMC [Planctomycetota bacterium]
MLTALELAGFKSFADKTRLEFPAGVTCVVGPNGSGKSNVVDAIKWVMGTQCPKALRGAELTDVIFNGSASRRPQNTAEVTLEFDNRAGLFELQSQTVRITRRVYRSGEGEYALNGSACRLKDIRELLAGTGAGVESYSIIEQGRVDALLRSSPKERRTLFEEAAGVSRFRLKKQEATRRLARVEQNLLRLSDIVDEVEGRLRRVRIQAGKAKRYREQTERLKQLRTQLGLTDWWAQTTRLGELDRAAAASLAECEALQAEITATEQAQHAADQPGDGAPPPPTLATLQQAMAGHRERIAADEAIVHAETHRLAEIAREQTHARGRLVAARAEAMAGDQGPAPAELRKQLAETRGLLAAATQKLRAEHEQLGALNAKRDALQEQRQEAVSQREELIAADERLSKRRHAVEARLEVARQQAADARGRLQGLSEQAAGTERALRAAAQQAAELQTHTQRAEAALQAAATGRDTHRSRATQLHREIAAAEAQLAVEQRRLADINQDLTRIQRLREDTAALLAPAAEGDAPRATVRGLVADLLHVDFDTAPMIEAALGDRTHHLVVDNGDALIQACNARPAALSQRATFQRLDSRTPAAAVDRVDLSGEPGVMGRADQFVGSDPENATLVGRLLGRTWLVDSLATAHRLAQGIGRGLSYVTFAGECLHADGAITLGESDADSGLLTRRKRAESLQESIDQRRRQIRALAEELAAAERLAEEADTALDGLRGEQQAQLVALAEARQQAATLTERHQHLSGEESRVASAVDQQAATERAAAEELQQIDTRRQENASRLQHTDAAINTLHEAIATVERDIDTAGKAIVEARVAIAKHEQRAEALTHQTQSAGNAARTDGGVEPALAALAEVAARAERCRQTLLEKRAALAEHRLAWESLAAEHRDAAEADRRARSASQRVAGLLAEARRRIDAAQSQHRQASLDAERLRLEQQALVSRMQEDYGIDLPAAAQRHGPPEPLPAGRKAMEREVATLRGEVVSIGAVNAEALEELDELEGRFAELSAQYRDLADAKATLGRLSSRISTESRQLFLATVEEVRGHFRELFRRLFGGGDADIVLLEEEGADPLDAGIDIAASPPGKELRSLSLMSGGEKTLTCVALLLAVFRTKPSPFCVLDEVDAALDEANIGRFTGVLSEFLSSTQFIVITHSKKTMTGCDTLYGVTMQESGVSKQVAVRFEDVGEDGQIDPAATLRRAA